MKKCTFPAASTFGRLMIIFCVIIIFFEIAGITIFIWGQNTIKTEIEGAAATQVQYLNDNFEVQVQGIVLQMENIVSNTVLREFALNNSTLSIPNFYVNLLQQSDLIATISARLSLVDDIVIYYNGFDKALSASKGYIPVSDNSYDTLTSAFRASLHPIRVVDSQLMIGTMYPINTLYSQRTPSFVLAISLSNSSVKDLLASFSSYDTILLDHTTLTSIHSNGSSSLEDELENQYLEQIDAAVQSNNGSTIHFDSGDYYIISKYSSYLNCSFIQILPTHEIMRIPRQFNLYLVLFVLVSVIVLSTYLIAVLKTVNQPIKLLLDAFKEIETGNFDINLQMRHPTVEFRTLITAFNSMAQQLNHTIDQLYRQEIYSQRMELKHLQMQINPHFLYNSYFILHRMISKPDMENAQLLSAHMGKYFRYITRNGQDEAPLQMEWEHAVNYLEIQAIRYSNRIAVEADAIPNEYKQILVPRLILQPILENAFEHGLKDQDGGGFVHLAFIPDESHIHIQVQDNGNCFTDTEIDGLKNKLFSNSDINPETTALINIHRRLILKFGVDSGLTLVRNTPYGLIVDLRISKEHIRWT